MNCPNANDWDLLATEALEDEQVEPLLEHVRSCQTCRAQFQAARRAHTDRVRMYEAFDRGHDESREQLMAALPDELPQRTGAVRLVRGWARLGDYVMSLNTTTGRRAAAILAPAACILVAVAIFLSPGQQSAFAAAIEHLKQAKTIVCRVTITANVRMRHDPQPGSPEIDPASLEQIPETETVQHAKLYMSAEHGVRRDAYEDDVLMSTSYTADDGRTLTLYPQDRTYETFDVDDELKQAAAEMPTPDINFMSPAQSPDRLLRGLRNLTADADRELGRETFDGRELIGYEIAGEKVGLGPPLIDDAEENRAELWVDAETGVVARLLFHFVTTIPGNRALPLEASFAMTIVYDRFEWDPPISIDWFEARIPEDYTRRATDLPEQTRMPDEAALLEALRVFSDVAGRYPASLNAMSVTYEVGFVLGALNAQRSAAERSEPGDPGISDTPSVGEKLQGLALYAILDMQGREPEYFGDTVTPDDAEKILLRWKLDDASTRVIYGDLRTETIPGSD